VNSPTVTSATVTPSPSTVNTTAQYTIDFTLGATALVSGDTIAITFPDGTTIPDSISKNTVTVKENDTTQTISSVATVGQKVIITVGESIHASDQIKVVFSTSSDIVNPTTSGNNYTLRVGATNNGSKNSNTYEITVSTISAANVTLSQTLKDSLSKYTITFNVGAMGALSNGDTVVIVFNDSTTLGSAVTTTDNDTIKSSAGTYNPSNVTKSGQTVKLVTPSGFSVSNNGSVTIIFKKATDMITNPGTAGNYNLQLRTNKETTLVTSNAYTITDPNKVSEVKVDSISNRERSNPSTSATYVVRFKRGQSGTLSANDTIWVTFPSGTTISSGTWSSGDAKILTQQNPSYTNATAIGSGQKVKVVVPSGVSANASDSIRVRLNVATGNDRIKNPSSSGSTYTLTVETSKDAGAVSSSKYTITSLSTEQISKATVTPSPDTTNASASYRIDFKTNSTSGALVVGDSIIIVFPSDTDVPASISASNITVDDVNDAPGPTQCTVAPVIKQNSRRISVVTPIALDAGDSVSVVFNSSSGLQNPSTAGEYYSVDVSTNINTNVRTSNYYTIKNPDGSVNVTLSKFEIFDGKRFITLHWRTETELNNLEWWIQKSERENGPFTTIRKIKGQGSTSQPTNYEYKDSQVKSGKIYYYRLVDIDFNGTITYHEVKSAKVLVPYEFRLSQNYPNPFNPTTKIEYDIPVNSRVKIEIFDVLGRRVKILVDETKESGFYISTWNGKNENNIEVASGVYFYRIIVKAEHSKKQFVQSKKMLVLK
jgi:hypothetical protein